MKAKSIKGKSPEEIKSAFQQCIADGFKPTLAIVFISVSQNRDAVCEILDAKGIKIFGVTTNGEFIDEDLSKESIAILLLDMDTNYFSVFFKEYRDKKYREVSHSIAETALHKFNKPAFLIAGSNMETDAEQLLLGFEDAVGKNVNVFGGMAGDDMNFKQQFVFTSGIESDEGIVVLALDEEKIAIKGKATCGWKAVGTEKTVTKSEGNRVYTVDNIPVLDLTVKYAVLPIYRKFLKILHL